MLLLLQLSVDLSLSSGWWHMIIIQNFLPLLPPICWLAGRCDDWRRSKHLRPWGDPAIKGHTQQRKKVRKLGPDTLSIPDHYLPTLYKREINFYLYKAMIISVFSFSTAKPKPNIHLNSKWKKLKPIIWNYTIEYGSHDSQLSIST